jgi:hypothetical protein
MLPTPNPDCTTLMFSVASSVRAVLVWSDTGAS